MAINSADIMTYTAAALKAQLDIFNFVHLSGGKITILVSVADQGGGKRIKLPHKLPSMPQYQRNVNLTAVDYQRNRDLLTNTLQLQTLRDLQVVSILRHLHLSKKSLDSFLIDGATTAAKIKKGGRRIDFNDDTVNVEDGVELGYIPVSGGSGREGGGGQSERWVQEGVGQGGDDGP